MPGLGHSSPIVWNDHLFLTSAIDDGRTRMLLDIDVNNGDVRWTQATSSRTHAIHNLNSFASSTPATDGRQVYVLFVSDDQMLVLAYDFDGEQIWKRDLGPFLQRESQVHGCGTSPIVFENLVIVANQQDGPSSIIALDAVTGETRWKNDRSLQLTAHSTPRVQHRTGSPPQLFFSNMGDGIASLNPRNGELVFRADLLTSRCVGSPVIAGNLVLATCGGGGRGKYMAAVPVESRGELDESAAVWARDRVLPYVPTPIAVGELRFLWGDHGVVVCVDADSGRDIWTERVGGDYSGSPVCVDGRIYCVARDGTIAVIDAVPEFQLLGRNSLGERCHSTPAVAAGRMFIRGFEHLYCLEARTTARIPSK
ncbi:MAG: PQQ-binding-like beta-propeller repeat protein [Planctomycetaceae bacterium]